MSNTGKQWWRDPKFLIPTIIIPIILAGIGIIPSLIRDEISDELSVSLDLRDAKRSDPGAIDISFEEVFDVGNITVEEAARNISKTIMSDIQSQFPLLFGERKPIKISVNLSSNSTLIIDEPLSESVSLHLTRFTKHKNLKSLMDEIIENSISSPVQQPLGPSGAHFPTTDIEVSEVERKMREGVYRLIVTSPGYYDNSIYLQLNAEGRVFTVSGPSTEMTEVSFPLKIKLHPSSRPMRIAISPCQVITSTKSKPKINDVGILIQTNIKSVFRSRGFDAFVLKEGQEVGFDLNVSKGMPPDENIIAADIIIEECICEWK